MPALNVDSDELSSMSAEIARGTPKEESLYANLSPDHSFMWGVLTRQIDRIKADGAIPEQTAEIQPPLMNQDYEDGAPPPPTEQAVIDEVDIDDIEEGL
jgi:hypothetical protein